MSDQIELSKEVEIIEAPNDKSKLATLDSLFRKHKVPTDDVYLPNEELYSEYEDPEYGLRFAAALIFRWLNIDPGKHLTIFYEEIEPAGLYINKDGSHYIIVNKKYINDPFASGAILAHEIMHYILLGKFKVQLEDNNENEKFTDMATIESGLGLLVINGFSYDSGWASTVIGLIFGRLVINQTKLSFGYYKPNQYGKHLYKNIKQLGIDLKLAGGRIVPQSRHFVPQGLRKGREKPSYVLNNERLVRRKNLKNIAMVILLSPIALLIWGPSFSGNDSSVSPELTQKKAAYDACVATAKKHESALKQTESIMNSAESRGDIDTYNSLVPRQNSQVITYNNQVDTCEALRQEYNSQIK